MLPWLYRFVHEVSNVIEALIVHMSARKVPCICLLQINLFLLFAHWAFMIWSIKLIIVVLPFLYIFNILFLYIRWRCRHWVSLLNQKVILRYWVVDTCDIMWSLFLVCLFLTGIVKILVYLAWLITVRHFFEGDVIEFVKWIAITILSFVNQRLQINYSGLSWTVVDLLLNCSWLRFKVI